MRKCCIYCRIDGSPTESNQDAMKNQLCSLREAAVSLGLTIAAEIAVFESGIDPLRQSIKTMIRDGRHGCYDCVLVANTSRLARNAEGLTLVGRKLNHAGVGVYTPTGRVQLAPLSAYCYSRYFTDEGTVIGSENRNEDRKRRIQDAFQEG